MPTHWIGNDAFQETPIVEVCRGITKHHYLVTDVNDVARVVKEAFFDRHDRPARPRADRHAQERAAGQDRARLRLPGRSARLHDRRTRMPKPEQIKQIAAAIKLAKRPVIYAGGGIISGEASEELRTLVKKTGIPVTMTVMGLGAFPAGHPLSLDMLGMHGSVYANYAVEQADLLLALGVRFDDRVTGKVEEFCKHGKIVHVDIDASELNKNKPAHIPVCSDVKYALAELNKIVEAARGHLGLGRAVQPVEGGSIRSTTTRSFPASRSSTRSANCGS